LGALAYFETMLEIYDQALTSGLLPDSIVIASGSGATQAGLLVGAAALGLKTRIIGVCVSDRKEEFWPVVKRISQQLIETLGLEVDIEKGAIILFDEYLGAGYGRMTEEISEVIRNIFQIEGIVLDPVYTSKAMIGLLDLVKRGYFSREEKVLFIHTGGTPALFAFRDSLIKLSK
ncbi:MAG: pyridoxal-phosphate dependent enzyme, partial [Candidatus Saccharicenans sp.]